MATTPEEEDIIKKRFLTQTTVTRGEPPLRRLAQRFLGLSQAVTEGQVARTAELREGLERDLAAIGAAASKQRAACAANAREQAGYVARRAALEADIAQAHAIIAQRKEELAAARVQKQRNEEYEVLRKAVMRYPKRASSVAGKEAVQREVEAIQAESAAVVQLIDRRRARLQAELLDPIDALVAAMEAEDGGGTNGGSAPMAVG